MAYRSKKKAVRFLSYVAKISATAVLSGCSYLFPPLDFSFDSSRTFMPNNYSYVTVDGTQYLIEGKWDDGGRQITYFNFLKRIYVDRRYIVGEIVPAGVSEVDPDVESKYKYFILDTKSDIYSGELNYPQWIDELTELDIDESELAPRSKQWKEQMWSQFGRGEDCWNKRR